MPFDTSNDYSELENFDSSPPLADSEGFIQPNEDATGFGYSKRILRLAAVEGSNIQVTLTGFWRGILRESVIPDSRVIFDQKVTFRTLCVFDILGGVTFIPLDNGGKFETTIVNGEAVPQDADGHYEGWRFVDTPTPTVFSEFGTPIFRANSGNSLNGVQIDIDWRSRNYKMDVPEGAVWRIEDDQWRQGTDIPIAFYKGTLLAGGGVPPALYDERLGVQLRVITVNGETRVVRSRRTQSGLSSSDVEWTQSDDTGFVIKPALKKARVFGARGGQTFVFGGASGAFCVCVSSNGGRTFTSVMNEPSAISILASCPVGNGARLLVYGVDAAKTPSFVMLKNEAQGWKITDSGPCTLEGAPETTPSAGLPTTKVNSLESGQGGLFRLLATGDGGVYNLFLSRDGKKWSHTPLTVTGGTP